MSLQAGCSQCHRWVHMHQYVMAKGICRRCEADQLTESAKQEELNKAADDMVRGKRGNRGGGTRLAGVANPRTEAVPHYTIQAMP